ncbi:uncharacterized protein LOC114956489 [Acropora millepora]|uniref:uncharacterized protein LOC114956489 n=1 Tax=Acropora millepora TaxID=45264 RepID=UPI001CF47C18|nr:uncharacterized protein LOC114956489 [Acropora millepora]
MEHSLKQSVDKLGVPEVSNAYDITGKKAVYVIFILKSIVNDTLWEESYRKRKEFTFKIEGRRTVIFSIKPKPHSYVKPGNGVVRRKYDPDDRRRIIKWSYGEELVKELNKRYSNDTKKFAQDIKRVFNNNSELFNCGNEVIQDVYILLLFEIGRRLVDDEKVPEEHRAEKQAYDSLPIS